LINVWVSERKGQAISIPGQVDEGFQRFERDLCEQLHEQHDRVHLFVTSKADEFQRRLLDYEQKADKLIGQMGTQTDSLIALRQRERLSKLETRAMRCGEDVRHLDTFIQAQRTAFHKILKHYAKSTGSDTLKASTENFLGSPKSFLKLDLRPLFTQYDAVVSRIRASSPHASEGTTPHSSYYVTSAAGSAVASSAGLPSNPTKRQAEELRRSGYWNEYDNPSDGEGDNQPYTIYVDPAEERFDYPGQKTFEHLAHFLAQKTSPGVQKIREWVGMPRGTTETEPLLGGRRGRDSGYHTSRTSPTETDVDEEAFHREFPDGYEPYFATDAFPSVHAQQMTHHRARTAWWAMIGAYAAAVVLLGISELLLLTGRHKLRSEVDAGVVLGVVSGMLFASLGLCSMVYRWAQASWYEIVAAALIFGGSCGIGAVELVAILGETWA
jgi:hypothetical protein